MPELTLDTITDRTRALASRTSDQVSKTVGGLLPAQVSRRTRTNRLQELRQWMQDLVQKTPLARNAPPAQQVGRRARKTAQRTGNRVNLPDLGDLLQRGALIFAGTRLATDWVQRMRRAAPSSGQKPAFNQKTPSLSLPRRRLVAARGSTTAARVAAKAATGPVRASYRLGVGVGTAKTTMRTAKTAGRGWWLFRRTQAQLQLQRGWKWARAFTIGFAIGGIWAYLFAPRQGPAFQRLQEGVQRSA
jgi:hypothetical protein